MSAAVQTVQAVAAVEPVEATSTTTTQTTTARKRRRRTAASGAADDCFACQKRQIRCDRRRPYCTQCLDIGKDCAGYKTTLTWGVGVASRGKLRGLALPIANTAKVSQGDVEPKSQQSSANVTSPASKSSEPEVRVKSEESSYCFGRPMMSERSSSYMSSSYPPSGPIPIPTVPHHQGWQVAGFHQHLEEYNSPSGKIPRAQLRPTPLQRAHTYGPGSFDEVAFSAPSTASVSTFSDSDFPSPNDFPPTPEEGTCSEPFISNNLELYFGGQETSRCGSISEPFPSLEVPQIFSLGDDAQLNFHMDAFDSQCQPFYPVQAPAPQVSASMPNTYFSDLATSSMVPQYPFTAQSPPVRSIDMASEYPSNAHSSWVSTVPQSFDSSNFHHLSPRMRYLVDYYDKTICPVLVAVDGPKNPYRVYILGLAAASGPALVNAIAALSANVLHLRTRGLGDDQFGMQSHPNHFTSEEALHYKTTSVNLFNTAVQDPASVQDDSILGTLLVLSLFTICDTGFCNFKSQMPGVRRILAMRGSNSTQFLHWATFFFTWLDVMSATVSDRENQVRHNTLDLLDFSANLGSLEHLAFCEGRMLKVVSRIGPPKIFSPQWSGQEASSPFSNSFMSSPRQALPRRQSYAGEAIMNGHSSAPESRHEFWSEWLHVRSRLRTWSRDAVSTPQDPSFTHESESVLVTHASEVFRHAALLFAERQAFPHVPPSSTQIQHLVVGALHHLSSIPVLAGINKFLLWPLCVLGTDCVRPMDRDVIRLRCGEAMRERGFFQTSSGLDVLERVWASEDASWDAGMGAWEMKCAVDMPRLSSLGGVASRWSRAMRMMVMDYGMPI